MTSKQISPAKDRVSNRGTARRRVTALLLAGALGLSTTGCFNTDNMSREDKIAIGTVAGAIAGAFLGYNLLGAGTGKWVAALAVGAAGAYGGRFVTDRLTRWDKTAMQDTAFNTLTDAPAGNSGTWSNPETGTNGTITPMRTFLDDRGRICREYEATITMGGDSFDGREIACRTATGDWVINQATG